MCTFRESDCVREPVKQRRPALEVADIFRDHGDAYRQAHALSKPQRQAMFDIERCRTAALGGHVDVCTECDFKRPAYNSCRNRHCPKCQALPQARWLEGRMERVLPVKHFHVVFTMPAELRPIALANRKVAYALLFTAAADTLDAFSRDPKRLGAQLGVTSVLHTWTRELKFHPHIHCIVTAGGLSRDEKRWVPTKSRGRFLFPVVPLGQVFRGKLLEAFIRARKEGLLRFEGPARQFADPAAFRRLMKRMSKKKWVVYAKRPFGGAKRIFAYLGQYTHRVGISNHRIVAYEGGYVTFRTRGDETVMLHATEFIRRFLLHILDRGFTKIRHYGLYASAAVRGRLEQARELLGPAPADEPEPAPPSTTTDDGRPADWRDLLRKLTGDDLRTCPACGRGQLREEPLEWHPEFLQARAPPQTGFP